MTIRFAGRKVLVTGASRGIGFAIADAFLERGADVYVLADCEDICAAAERLAEKHDHPVEAIRSDITNLPDISKKVKGIGKLDVLINNAGLEYITPMDDMSDEGAACFKRIIDTNILGTYYVTRSAVQGMTSGGRIIITSSIWGKTAVAEFSAYCSSKHANIGFMRSLAQELGPRGITVNAVCPGWVHTEAAMRSLKFIAERSKVTEGALLEQIVTKQAMEGLLEPDEVVAPYLFLASDMASCITGQALNIDRGEVMA